MKIPEIVIDLDLNYDKHYDLIGKI